MGVRFNRKFTDSEVEAIRSDLARGVARRAIARAMGVTTQTIDRIARGDTYLEPEQTVPPEAKKEIDASWDRLWKLQQEIEQMKEEKDGQDV